MTSPVTVHIDFSQYHRSSFLPQELQEPSVSTYEFRSRQLSNLKSVKVQDCYDDQGLCFFISRDGLYRKEPLKKFCTGSSYLGQWSNMGIAGKGIYKFPHGVIYDGSFNKQGEFHGSGTLIYPNGQRVEGLWRNGRLEQSSHFVSKNGDIMSKNYCEMPDRRFQIEMANDFNPPGQEYLTNEPLPPRKIPSRCYDLTDSYYNPKVKTIYAYKKSSSNLKAQFSNSVSPSLDKMKQESGSDSSIMKLIRGQNASGEIQDILWIPSPAQEEWIEKNCRKAWDDPTGYRPDLYEQWSTGGQDEPEGLQMTYFKPRTDHQIMVKNQTKRSSNLRKFS